MVGELPESGERVVGRQQWRFTTEGGVLRRRAAHGRTGRRGRWPGVGLARVLTGVDEAVR
ncbi:hypothetical protein QJS04_geneDACA017967 [Acorus gramineus]|uniref:MHC class I antigen n=1 Tax=Acorus gramineus TaxID=55184 RepID=A0AAV9A4A1_ACOGR|nr:hypothetical protein QJS04_geneDACA017967 [Acorus gramineus]